MNNTLQILADFLDKYGEDVQGHALEAPTAELQKRLTDFAQGRLDEAGRAQLSQWLKENPQWIANLAAEVRSRTPS